MAWIPYGIGVFFLAMGVELKTGNGNGFIVLAVFAFIAAFLLFVDEMIRRCRGW